MHIFSLSREAIYCHQGPDIHSTGHRLHMFSFSCLSFSLSPLSLSSFLDFCSHSGSRFDINILEKTLVKKNIYRYLTYQCVYIHRYIHGITNIKQSFFLFIREKQHSLLCCGVLSSLPPALSSFPSPFCWNIRDWKLAKTNR